MLEEAVAILEPTFLRRKAACFTRKHDKTFDSMDNIFSLYAISTDILHRRSSHFSGNTCKILDTTEPLLKSPIHEIRPFLARTDNSEDRIFIFVITHDPLDSGMKYKPFKIPYKQKIASSPDIEYRIIDEALVARKSQQFLFRGILSEITRPDRNAESRQICYILVLFNHRGDK